MYPQMFFVYFVFHTFALCFLRSSIHVSVHFSTFPHFRSLLIRSINQVETTCWIVAPRNFQVLCVGYSCVLLASEAVWWLSPWTLRLTMRLGLREPARSEQGMTSHRMWAPPRQAKLATPITVVYETDDL